MGFATSQTVGLMTAMLTWLEHAVPSHSCNMLGSISADQLSAFANARELDTCVVAKCYCTILCSYVDVLACVRACVHTVVAGIWLFTSY